MNGTPAKCPATPLSVKNGLNTPLRKITLAGKLFLKILLTIDRTMGKYADKIVSLIL